LCRRRKRDKQRPASPAPGREPCFRCAKSPTPAWRPLPCVCTFHAPKGSARGIIKNKINTTPGEIQACAQPKRNADRRGHSRLGAQDKAYRKSGCCEPTPAISVRPPSFWSCEFPPCRPSISVRTSAEPHRFTNRVLLLVSHANSFITRKHTPVCVMAHSPHRPRLVVYRSTSTCPPPPRKQLCTRSYKPRLVVPHSTCPYFTVPLPPRTQLYHRSCRNKHTH
jgi:hypothetical protein